MREKGRDRTGDLPQPLPGGIVNEGAVLRRGTVVERPAPRHAAALHAHLRALAAHGFDAAPTPLHLTADGRREHLRFVPGEVALPPFPRWAMTDTTLVSVAGLLRRLHDAGAAVPCDPDTPWPRSLADPRGGTTLCHNDLCPENVVLHDGKALALLDFDLAAPGRPLWDVAMTARYWVPLLDPASAAALYPAGLSVPARLRLFADGYGLTGPERRELPAVLGEVTRACRAFVAARVAEGHPGYVQALARRGGWERWDRLETWLEAQRSQLAAALLD